MHVGRCEGCGMCVGMPWPDRVSPQDHSNPCHGKRANLRKPKAKSLLYLRDYSNQYTTSPVNYC